MTTFLIFLFVIAVAGIFSILIYRKSRSSKEQQKPVVRYVCPVCNERDCICHREGKTNNSK